MLPTAHVRGATVAVQHIYRDSKAIADALGGTVDPGGWYPGTGVAFRTVTVADAFLTVVSVIDYHQSRQHPWGRTVYEASRPGTALLSIELSGSHGLSQAPCPAWVPQRRTHAGSLEASRPVTRAEAPDHWFTLEVVDSRARVAFADVVAAADVLADGTFGTSPTLTMKSTTGAIEFVATPR